MVHEPLLKYFASALKIEIFDNVSLPCEVALGSQVEGITINKAERHLMQPARECQHNTFVSTPNISILTPQDTNCFNRKHPTQTPSPTPHIFAFGYTCFEGTYP